MALATGQINLRTETRSLHRRELPRWWFHIALARVSYLLTLVAWRLRDADRAMSSWATAHVRVRRDLVAVFFLSYVVTFGVAVLVIAGQR